MAVQLGPVPSTDEKSHVRQNTAIQQLFAALADLFNTITIGSGALVNAANDAAAAGAGVAVGQMYRNGSILMVRVV